MMPTKLDAAAALESMDSVAPSFDFGADDQTNALLLQDAQTFITGNMARIMAAKHAHDLTANHYKGSWGKWCNTVGISRDTGDNMVRVAEQFGNIQLDGQSIFDVRPMKLLYAAAKSSTPEPVKQAVFSGDITTYKEYQELMAQLKAERDRADTTEGALNAAIADVNGLSEQNAQLQQSYHDADESRIAANLQRQKAEAERDKAEARARDMEKQLSGSRQMAEAAKLRSDKLKAENDALKQQPIAAVVDEDEIDRRAKELADAQVAEIRTNLEKARDADDGRQAYDSLIMAGRSLYSVWMAVKPLISKVSPSTRKFALEQIIRPAKHIIEEAEKCQ